MTQNFKEWLDDAWVDYKVAQHLNDTFYPKPLEVICYHCQQAAEKAIKAFIIYNGVQGEIPKVHDLSFLLNQVKNKVEIEEKYFDYADILTPYGIQVRYPNEMYVEEYHANKALEYSREILEWIDKIIADS